MGCARIALRSAHVAARGRTRGEVGGPCTVAALGQLAARGDGLQGCANSPRRWACRAAACTPSFRPSWSAAGPVPTRPAPSTASRSAPCSPGSAIWTATGASARCGRTSRRRRTRSARPSTLHNWTVRRRPPADTGITRAPARHQPPAPTGTRPRQDTGQNAAHGARRRRTPTRRNHPPCTTGRSNAVHLTAREAHEPLRTISRLGRRPRPTARQELRRPAELVDTS